jgi:hypothetical protein
MALPFYDNYIGMMLVDKYDETKPALLNAIHKSADVANARLQTTPFKLWGHTVTVQTYYTRNEEEWQQNRWKNFMKGCSVVVLLYNVYDWESFMAIPQCLKTARNVKPDAIYVLLGDDNPNIGNHDGDHKSEHFDNHYVPHKQVQTAEAQELAQLYNIPFFEATTTDYQQTTEVFQSIVKMAMIKMKLLPSSASPLSLSSSGAQGSLMAAPVKSLQILASRFLVKHRNGMQLTKGHLKQTLPHEVMVCFEHECQFLNMVEEVQQAIQPVSG